VLLGFASDTIIVYRQGLLLLNPTYGDGDLAVLIAAAIALDYEMAIADY